MLQHTGGELLADDGEALIVGVVEGVGLALEERRCVCMPEPCTPLSGFGMNVAYTPRSMAIFFTTSRSVMMLSAMLSASV